MKEHHRDLATLSLQPLQQDDATASTSRLKRWWKKTSDLTGCQGCDVRSIHQLNKTTEYLSACSSSGKNTFAGAEEREVGCQSYPKDGPHVTWQKVRMARHYT